jgi:hypothetical protein
VIITGYSLKAQSWLEKYVSKGKEKLGEIAGFFALLRFFGETQDFIHNLHVGQ